MSRTIKTINIVLIAIMICVTVWGIYSKNWNILVANICIISGVLIEEKTTKLLMKENANINAIRKIRKFVVPSLYIIGAISLVLLGYNRFL